MTAVKMRYYETNKRLMTCVGAWPYQSSSSRLIALLVYMVVAIAQLCCKTAFVVVIWPDINLIIQGASAMVIDMIGMIKVINCLVNMKKMRALLDNLLKIEKSPLSAKEDQIMADYADNGRRFTTIWTVYLLGTLLTWLSTPQLADMLGKSGENDTKVFPSPVYYGIDEQKYYYPVLAHCWLAGIVFTLSLIMGDTLFAICIEHGCGMFAVLSYKLENAIQDPDDGTDNNLRRYDDVTYNNYSDCIVCHNEVIKFAELIESAHTTSFLFTVGLTMLLISVTGVSIVSTTELHALLRQLTLFLSQMFHLLIENYFAQRLLDHSDNVYTDILMSAWYRCSSRSKKLLCMFIRRSLKPCALTAGGLSVMSIQYFSTVLQNSMSYFTLLQSVR